MQNLLTYFLCLKVNYYANLSTKRKHLCMLILILNKDNSGKRILNFGICIISKEYCLRLKMLIQKMPMKNKNT